MDGTHRLLPGAIAPSEHPSSLMTTENAKKDPALSLEDGADHFTRYGVTDLPSSLCPYRVIGTGIT